MRDFVVVYNHQQPFVVEMVMDILKKNNIPCFMQQRTIGGIELSPVAPTAAPGIEYVVYVHKSQSALAKEILKDLPVDAELLSVSWTKSSNPRRQKLLWIYWGIILGMLFVFLILEAVSRWLN